MVGSGTIWSVDVSILDRGLDVTIDPAPVQILHLCVFQVRRAVTLARRWLGHVVIVDHCLPTTLMLLQMRFASFVVVRAWDNLGYLGASVKHLPQFVIFHLESAISAL